MKKILVADDSLFMRKMLIGILSEKYEVIEASDGDTARELFKKEKPDLVLQDIIMPKGEEEGLLVLKDIMKTNPKAKVIMITAVGHEEIIAECKKLGAVDYITKPFDEENIIERAEKHLR